MKRHSSQTDSKEQKGDGGTASRTAKQRKHSEPTAASQPAEGGAAGKGEGSASHEHHRHGQTAAAAAAASTARSTTTSTPTRAMRGASRSATRSTTREAAAGRPAADHESGKIQRSKDENF